MPRQTAPIKQPTDSNKTERQPAGALVEPLWDQQALTLAQAALNTGAAVEAVILFGSRARGNYDPTWSDIDLLVLTQTEPDPEDQTTAAVTLQAKADVLYQEDIPVQLVWLTLERFQYDRRYWNSLATYAVQEGIILTNCPTMVQTFQRRDNNTERYRDWSLFLERLNKAELFQSELTRPLAGIEPEMLDLFLGQYAHQSLQYGLKALLDALGPAYCNSWHLADLLDRVRRLDPELRSFQLALPPEVYDPYSRQAAFPPKPEPRLTSLPEWLARTQEDSRRITQRAKAVQLLRQ